MRYVNETLLLAKEDVIKYIWITSIQKISIHSKRICNEISMDCRKDKNLYIYPEYNHQ